MSINKWPWAYVVMIRTCETQEVLESKLINGALGGADSTVARVWIVGHVCAVGLLERRRRTSVY